MLTELVAILPLSFVDPIVVLTAKRVLIINVATARI